MSNKLIVGILSLAVVFTTACKRETVVGAQRGFATANFKVEQNFDVNIIKPNFQSYNKSKPAGPLFFSATFNEDVNWTIHITSDDSGAEMKINGKGKVIDVNNGWWQGEASSNRFFAKSDTCYASLNILGIDTPIVLSKKIIIANTLSYHYRVVDGVKYFVVDDFEGATIKLVGVSGDAADNGTPKYGTYEDYAVEGSKSYHMEGTDVNKNGWLISINHDALVELARRAEPVTQKILDSNISISDPNELYFNLYIRGTGQTNSAIELKTYEVDSAASPTDLITRINKGFSYNAAAQASNDGWIYDITVDWEGWKLVSIPYSKFRPSSDLLTGGNGNRIKEPWKISAMAVSLLSYPTSGLAVSADIDFLVISEGGPFVPKY